MDESQFKTNLRTWFSPRQQTETGDVKWGDNDPIISWQDIERQYLQYRWIGRALQPKRLLEVGVGFGYSTLSMLSAVENIPEVYWIDDSREWPGSVSYAHEKFKLTYGQNPCSVSNWRDSVIWGEQKFDVIHLDAGHTYASVCVDLLHSVPYWNDEQVHVLIHDTDDPPVSQAIDNFVWNKPYLAVKELPVRCGMKVLYYHDKYTPFSTF